MCQFYPSCSHINISDTVQDTESQAFTIWALHGDFSVDWYLSACFFCFICRFLVFRACTLGWMSRWLARHSEHIPRYVLMMGAAGMSLISTMNVAMFYKMFKADILKNMRNATENH